jgi:hypothetical protein
MIPTGKCPKCNAVVGTHAVFEKIVIGEFLGGHSGQQYHGFTIVCPNPKCSAILGAGFDPIAIQADTVAQILKGLGAKKGR